MRWLPAAALALVACGARVPPQSPARTSHATLFAEGERAEAQGDLGRAEQYFALALRAGHDPAVTTRALVAACVRAGRLRSALAYAGEQLAQRPDDTALRRLAASLAWALGEPERAAAELRLVLALSPRDLEALYLLALVLPPSPEARAAIERYLELAPAGEHALELRAALAAQPPAPPPRRKRSS